MAKQNVIMTKALITLDILVLIDPKVLSLGR